MAFPGANPIAAVGCDTKLCALHNAASPAWVSSDWAQGPTAHRQDAGAQVSTCVCQTCRRVVSVRRGMFAGVAGSEGCARSAGRRRLQRPLLTHGLRGGELALLPRGGVHLRGSPLWVGSP